MRGMRRGSERRSQRTGRFMRGKRRDYGYEPSFRTERGIDRYERNEPYRGDFYDDRYNRSETRDYGYGMRDYGYDDDDCYLSSNELMKWARELFAEIPDSDRPLFSKENVERKAQEMAITFKDFTFEEFYTATLMLYTDYYKTLGMGNLDIYAKLAKDFLMDSDLNVDGGEKLALYYEYIVCAD